MIISIGKTGYLNALEQLAIQHNWLYLTPYPKISPSWTLPEFQLWRSNATLHNLPAPAPHWRKQWWNLDTTQKAIIWKFGRVKKSRQTQTKSGRCTLTWRRGTRSSASSSVSPHGSAHSTCRGNRKSKLKSCEHWTELKGECEPTFWLLNYAYAEDSEQLNT